MKLNFVSSSFINGDYSLVSNIPYNAVLNWKLDVFGHFLLNYFPNLEVLFIAYFVFITFGIYLILNNLSFGRFGNFRAILLSLSFSFIAILLFGFDLVLFSSFSWFLIFYYFLIKFDEKILSYAKIVLSFFFILLSAHQFSFVLLLFPLIFREIDGLKIKFTSQIYFIFLIISFIYSLFIPAFIVPEYPEFAHVVPDDNLSGHLYPYFGFAPSIPTLNREIIKSFGLIFSFLFLFLYCLEILSICFRKCKLKFSDLFLPLILLSILLLDSAPSEVVAHVMPLSSLSRLIPGLFLYPISLHIAFILLFLFFVQVLSQKTNVSIFLISLLVLAVSVYVDLARNLMIGRLKGQEVVQKDSNLLSPSLNLYRVFGLELDKVLYNQNNLVKIPLSKFQPEVLVSRNIEDVSSLIDQDFNTTWSPTSGSQLGDEYLVIKFPKEVRAIGLGLRTDGRYSDFPRGLEIVKDCSDLSFLQEKKSKNNILFYSSNWQGPVRFTIGGFPYFGGQGDVELIFPNEFKTDCLYIGQIGKSDHFDWSVSEIELYQLSN